MKRFSISSWFLLVSLAMLIAGCSPTRIEERDLSSFFREQSVEGSFLLYDLREAKWLSSDIERCRTRFIPASTFKILNALIALDSGVIQNESEIIAWDGTLWPIEAWNQDHDLRSAMRHSVVWYYEELAQRVGKEKMQDYIDLVGYGNQKTTGPNTAFWLVGDTRISQWEQIDFLIRLYQNDLPFSSEDQEIVKDLILLDETESYRLFGKTGWATSVDPDTGWFIGYLEQDDAVFFFATNLEKEGSEASLGSLSKEITIQILADLALIE